MRKTINSIVIVISVCLFFCAIPFRNLSADAFGKCGDNLNYSWNGIDTLLISGSGAMYDYENKTPWYSYQKMIKKIEFSGDITSIGDFAFSDCPNLASVSIPESVMDIGYGAFSNCTKLSSVNISFGVLNIGKYAFDNCTSLSSVSIPSTVKTIDECAFQDCGLTKVTIASGVFEIGEYAFRRCDKLQTLTIPGSVSKMGYGSFAECTGLKSVLIYDGWLTTIGESVFDHCTSLTSVTLPNGIESIGDGTFMECESLTEIKLPKSLITIGDGTFGDCTSLKSIELPENLMTIGNCTFSSCESITSIFIPSGVYELGCQLFFECTSLSSISIPDSVISVDREAFLGCSGLKDVYYDGSKSDWGNISIGKSNSALTDATVHFAEFSVTISSGQNGKASLSRQRANEGDEITIYSYPNDGYEVDTIKVDGVSISGNKFTMPAKAVSVEVTFKKHVIEAVAGKAATCEQEGYEPYYKCGSCNKLFSDAEGKNEISAPKAIKALGHSWDEGTETKPATCEEAGEKTFHCTRDGCKETKKETIGALGHKLKEVPEKAPTKTEAGNYAYYECERCHKLFKDSDGKEAITLEQTVIPALTHNLTHVKAKAATCTESGNIEYYKCEDSDCNCGKYYSDKYGQHEISAEETIVPPLKHDLKETEAKPATCTEDGYEKYYKCSRCNKIFSDPEGKNEITEPVVVSKLGHDLKKVDAVKETYLKDGNIEYYICQRCGKKFADDKGNTELSDAEIIIPKKGAAELGETAEADDFSFTVTNPATDGTGTVSLNGVADLTPNVSIPATVEIKDVIYKVSRIESNAFNDNKTIRSLYIGANVVTIDAKAFYGCSNLTKVSGGASLKSIGSYAFAKCPKLSSFKVSSKVLSNVGAYAFSGDKKLKTLYIKYTTKLTKSGVKKSLKGSKIKTVKVKKSKVKKYKKYFTKKNCGRKVKVKK